MSEDHTLKFERNIAKILERAIELFRETDLDDLADKWEKILRNYYVKKEFRE